MAKTCVLCLSPIDTDEADVLAMGGFGTPRYVCECCSHDIDIATRGRDYDEIVAAMDRISEKLAENAADDTVTQDTATLLLVNAAKRAKEIREGTYDFALDEVEAASEFDEIPEELRETEEDRELDRAEEEAADRLDKILNWVWAAVLVGTVGFMVWWLFF